VYTVKDGGAAEDLELPVGPDHPEEEDNSATANPVSCGVRAGFSAEDPDALDKTASPGDNCSRGCMERGPSESGNTMCGWWIDVYERFYSCR
jgi:hypothetical protein